MRHILFCTIFLISLINLSGQNDNFYNEDSIIQVDIQFNQKDYWQQLLNNYESKTNLPGTVSIGDEVFDSTGVRFKGSTTFLANPGEKKSFALSLNEWVQDQEVQGYNTLNLHSSFEDPSFFRILLYNWYGRQYGLSLKSNIAHLSINGENWGPYINVQQLNSDYIRERFPNTDGTRWRSGVGFNGGPGGASLNFLGTDTTVYSTNYTMKKTSKSAYWTDLINTARILENSPLDSTFYDTLKQVLDIDRTVWFLAHETIFSDEDSYIVKGGRDYYIYWDSLTGQITPLEYDGNSTMYPENIFWSPFYNEDNPRFALCYRFLQTPELRQRYLAHVRTILEEYVRPEIWEMRINHYVDLLDPLVVKDPKVSYSYEQFVNNQDSVRFFLEQRRNFILSNEEVDRLRPSISTDVLPIGFDQPHGQSISVSVSVSTDVGTARVRLYYSNALYGSFDRIDMLDNGEGIDLIAGDNIFSVSLPAADPLSYMRYYVEAIADDEFSTVTYLPSQAAQDPYIYRTAQSSGDSEVVINELLSRNDTTLEDEFTEYDDWIELYNKGTSTVDLSGYYLSDNEAEPDKWELPANVELSPAAYLLIWADEDQEQGALHTNFKLSGSGESLLFSSPELVLLDAIQFPELGADTSLSRLPNGTGVFSMTPPTPMAVNMDFESGLHTLQLGSFPLDIYPNPTSGILNIVGEGDYGEILLMDGLGNVMRRISEDRKVHNIDLKLLDAGIYFLQVVGYEPKRFLVLR